MNTEQFIEKAKKVHGDFYDYSKVKYVGANKKVDVVCKKHGVFSIRPSDHLHNKEGCPICKLSKLEAEIRNKLIENKISFIHKCDKKNFGWLGRQHLDFYLPDYNVAIECQGEQHYKRREKNNLFGDIGEIVERDISKYNKCIEHNVCIIYFSKTNEINNIEIYSKLNLFNNSKELIEKITNKNIK